MKRQVIAIALGSLLALPAFANVETGLNAGEILPGISLPVADTGKTRADVRMELVEAQQAGDIVANAELGKTRQQTQQTYRTDSMADSGPARADFLARSPESVDSTDQVLSERQL